MEWKANHELDLDNRLDDTFTAVLLNDLGVLRYVMDTPCALQQSGSGWTNGELLKHCGEPCCFHELTISFCDKRR